MRPLALCLALLAFTPRTSAEPPLRPTRDVAITVSSTTAINSEELETLPVRSLADIAVYVPSGLAGTTNQEGRIHLSGTTFHPGQSFYASFGLDPTGEPRVLALDTRPDPSRLFPSDVIDRVEVLQGPQGTLWGCPEFGVAVNPTAGIVNLISMGCEEPVIWDLNCPAYVSVGNPFTVTATVNTQAAEPVDYQLSLGGKGVNNDPLLSIRPFPGQQFVLRDSTGRIVPEFGKLWADQIDFSEYTTGLSLSLTARNDYGSDSATCDVEVEPDVRPAPFAGIHVGYSLEFKDFSLGVKGRVPLPVRSLPLTLDGTLDYYLQGGGSTLINLKVEAAYTRPLSDRVLLSAGAGPHVFFQSYDFGGTTQSNTEIGVGATGTLHYDLGGPIVPSLEVSLSRVYGQFAPYVGATFGYSLR